MIVKIGIKNFRSIKEEIEIDLEAASGRGEKSELLENLIKTNNSEYIKTLSIYGKNASGKSNIIKAVQALVYLIKQSDSFKHEEKIPVYEPFLFEEGCDKLPTELSISFITFEGIKYDYFLIFNGFKIIKEALYFYPKRTKAKLFVRENSVFSFGEYFKGEKSLLEKIVLENQLVLSKTASYNFPYLKEAYLYIVNELVLFNSIGFEGEGELAKKLLKLESNKISKFNLLEFLNSADLSIKDFKVIEKEIEPESLNSLFPKNISLDARNDFYDSLKYEVMISHNTFKNGSKVEEKLLPLKEESMGTQKILSLGNLFFSVLESGKTLFIDELENSIHPLLARMLVKLFNSNSNNPNKAQLIFTTHNESLMDNELLRRDQIAITDKNYEGFTEFYRISDINGVRADRPLNKWYLSGRFGGIPVVCEPRIKFETKK